MCVFPNLSLIFNNPPEFAKINRIIESTEILKQNPFTKYGKPSRIAALFGGTEKYREARREIENELYKVA